jgi:hypothetical protein
MQQHVFAPEREEEEIRALWKTAHQRVLLDEAWLSAFRAITAVVKTTSEEAECPLCHRRSALSMNRSGNSQQSRPPSHIYKMLSEAQPLRETDCLTLDVMHLLEHNRALITIYSPFPVR